MARLYRVLAPPAPPVAIDPIIGHLDDLLVAGVAVWWFLRTCPPSIALEHLQALEATPLGRFGRALPWVLGAALFAASAMALVLFLARRNARSP